MEAIALYGRRYPVLKYLDDNCAVVCTPEGPAIYSGTHHSISALWLASDHVSKNTVKEAVSAVVEWAKGQPTYPGSDAQEADSIIDRYRRERDEQYARRQTIEGELDRVLAERDVFASEIKKERQRSEELQSEVQRLRSEIERKDAALREAIDAFERYEMDVDDCASPAHRAMMTRIRTALSPAEGRPPATGKTAESSRQGILDSSPQPHNPDNLTPEQVGVSDGWRLLDEDEIVEDAPKLKSIETCFPVRWDSSGWNGAYSGSTYRTKLTRDQLRKARGLGESDVSEHRTLVGTTLKISSKERDGLRKAIGMNDGKEAN